MDSRFFSLVIAAAMLYGGAAVVDIFPTPPPDDPFLPLYHLLRAMGTYGVPIVCGLMVLGAVVSLMLLSDAEALPGVQRDADLERLMAERGTLSVSELVAEGWEASEATTRLGEWYVDTPQATIALEGEDLRYTAPGAGREPEQVQE